MRTCVCVFLVIQYMVEVSIFLLLQLKCCGVNDKSDFFNINVTYIPASCCPNPDDDGKCVQDIYPTVSSN